MDISTYSIIDYDELNANTMNNRGLQEELFGLFFEQAERYIEEMRVALAADSMEDWRMTTHGVKGASLSLGFIRLAKIAGACEAGLFNIDALRMVENAVRETQHAVEMREAA